MASSVESIVIRGRYFWKGNDRFLLKGVVYQIRGQDPLADDSLDKLRRSIPYMKELGLNAIFVYSINNTMSHDAAMELLAECGIYVLFCLSTPRSCINRHAPLESYKPGLLQEFFSTIDCVAAYPNTLGIIVANEVINSGITTQSASVTRAITRDVKNYMSFTADICQQRILPVGVSSSKIMSVFKSEFDYLTGGDQSEALDFFCFNNYSWCGKSSMRISGYDQLVRLFTNAHIPVFFSEYGCNNPSPRLFHETKAIYSSEMTGVFSGGLVYEFFELGNAYGLVKLTDDGKLELKQDFNNLKRSIDQCVDLQPNTLVEWSESQACAEKAPTGISSSWQASTDIPDCPLDWEDVLAQVEDGQWVDVEREIREFEVDDLANSMWQRFRIDGTGPRWT